MIKVFETQEQSTFKSHLGRLVQLAKADGEFHRKEQKFIRKLGRENGLDPEEIDEVMFYTKNFEVHIPESTKERFYQLVDFVELMSQDGHISDSEIRLCQSLACQLGFNKTISGLLINKIERGLEAGFTKAQIRKECKLFITY